PSKCWHPRDWLWFTSNCNTMMAVAGKDFISQFPLGDNVSNVYQLADVKGLKWRRYQARTDTASLPLSDPILVSYANALAQDVLCVWQHLKCTSACGNSSGKDDSAANITDPNHGHDCCSSKSCQVFGSGMKELWLFWFGDDPNLSNILSSELKDVEYGTFKDGFTYRCRILLFKAIHNSIERGLLAKSFVRYGRWFVEPERKDKKIYSLSNEEQVSVAFSFFLFGKSTVCTSVEIQHHSSLYSLTVDDITKARQSLNGLDVLLSPFGLKGTLTGRTYSTLDGSREMLKEWNHFYPIHLNSDSDNYPPKSQSQEKQLVPPVVEVVLDKVCMKYPACYVLVPVRITPKAVVEKKKIMEEIPTLPPDFISKITNSVWHRCSTSNFDKSSQSTEYSSVIYQDNTDIDQSTKIWRVTDPSVQSKCNCPLNTSTVNKSTTSATKKASLLQIQSTSMKPSIKTETKSNFSPSVLEPYHKRQFPNSEESKQKTSQVITNGSSDPIPYNGSVTLEESESKRIILKIINPNKNTFVSSPTSSFSNSSPSSPSLSDNVFLSPKGEEKDEKNRILDRKTNSGWFGRGFTNAGSDESKSAYPWQCYDLPGEDETKPPALPVDREESKIFENEKKRGAKDSKSGVNKTKGTTVTVETEQPTPKKKPRVNSTNTRKAGATNRRRNSTKASAAKNAAIDTSVNVLADNTDITPEMNIKESNPAKSKSEIGKKRKYVDGDGSTASPMASSLAINNDKFSAVIHDINYSTPVVSSRLCRPEDLTVTASDLDQIFNTDDESNPSMDQVEKQFSGGEYNATGITSHSSLSNDVGGVSSSVSLEAINSNSLLADEGLFSGEGGIDGNISNGAASKEASSTNIDGSGKDIDCLAATPYSVIDRLPSSAMSHIILSSKLRYIPPKKPLRGNGYNTSNSRSNISYFSSITEKFTNPIVNGQISDSISSSPSVKEHSYDIVEPILAPAIESSVSSFPEGHSLCINLVLSDSIINAHLDSNNEWLQDLLSSVDSCRSAEDVRGRKYIKQFETLISEAGLFDDDITSLVRDFFHGTVNRNLSEKKITGKNKLNNVGYVTDIVLHILCNQCIDAVFDQRLRANRRFEPNKKVDKSFKKLIFRNVLHNVYQSAIAYSKFVLGKENSGGDFPSSNENRWEYIETYEANGIKPSTVIVLDVLHKLHPVLNDLLHRCTSTSWENIPRSSVQGPLTWQQLHNKSNNVDNEEIILRIPKIMTGYEQDWLVVSPFAIPHWERLSLEPFATPNDVSYVVVAPENDAIYDHVKRYFKELSSVYEACKLGTHQPITNINKDGVIRVGRNRAERLQRDDPPEWFHKLDPCPEVSLLKLYIQFCKQPLLYTLRQLDDSPVKSHIGKPFVASSVDKTTDSSNGTGIATALSETKKRNTLPCVVVYMVDPFNFTCDSLGDAQTKLKLINGNSISSASLLIKCFEEVTALLPAAMKRHIVLHIVPCGNVQHLLSSAPPARPNLSNLSLLKAVAFSVYVKCKRYTKLAVDAKSLTGFGMAAVRAQLLGNEKVVDSYSRIHTPLYVIAPSQHVNHYDLSGVTENMIAPRGQRAGVMFCAYHLSENREWLLCVCSDINGEMMEPGIFHMKSIKQDIDNKEQTCIRSVALKKLLGFCVSLMSKTILQWRLVIIRFGKVGPGELKAWGTSNGEQAAKCSSIVVTSSRTDTPVLSPTSKAHSSSATFNNYNGSSIIDNTSSTSNMFPNDDTGLSDHDNLNDWLHNLEPSFSPTPGDTLNSSMDTTSVKQNIDKSQQDSYRDQRLSVDKARETAMSHHPLAIGYLFSEVPTGIFFKSFWMNSDQNGYSSPVLLKVLLTGHTIISPDNSSVEDCPHALDSTQACDVLRYIMERLDAQSWLTINSISHQRRSCLPYYLLGLQKLDQLISRF
ncbi:Mediator of RNA polymerase II transcription subunit 13, partial [Trichoplax sp. H2]